MKRALLAVGLAAAALVPTAPAHAAIGGDCDGDIDVACRQNPCDPDIPCIPRPPQICLVWLNGSCAVL